MTKSVKIISVQNLTNLLKDVKYPPIPSNEGFISVESTSVIWLDNINIKSAPLTGHLHRITALGLSVKQDVLVTCSKDKIILWRTEDIFKNSFEKENLSAYTILGVHIGSVSQCVISCNAEWMALCKEHEIWIIILKVWNVRCSIVLHQASILGSHRISFSSFSSIWPSLLLVGSNRGLIHLFRLKTRDEKNTTPPRLLLALDLARYQRERNALSVNAGLQSFKCENQLRRTQELNATDENSTEAGCIILNATLVKSENEANEEHFDNFEEDLPNGFSCDHSTLKSILKPGPILLACSNLGIAAYNINAAECLCFLAFSELASGKVEAPIPCLDYAVLSSSSSQNVRCILRSLGGAQAFFFNFKIVDKETSKTNERISMLARNPVGAKSVLRVEMKRRCDKPSSCNLYSSTNCPLQNKPRNKIKSSGYGLPPRALKFTPLTRLNCNKSMCQLLNAKTTPSVNIQSSGSLKYLKTDASCELLKSWEPPLKLDTKLLLGEKYGSALRMGISGDGNHLACGSRKLITVLNSKKLNLEDCVTLVGHDNYVNSVAFSLDNYWLISASDDGSSKVWDWKNKRCVLNIPGSHNSIEDKKSRSPQKQPQKTSREKITQAGFYYMDHFIVQAVGSHLDLSCHTLHEDGPNVSKSTSCLVRRVNLPTQEVTCFLAANRYHSNYLVVGSSNRSLLVYDVDSERLALTINGAHNRPPHVLCPLTGSSSLAQPARILDLTLSSAICDGVKLWDLRSAQCVQKYSRHHNRAHLSGIDVSSCCRYIAVASEDKCVYLYDSRQCHDYISKLSGFTVPVMDVLFNPCKAQIFAAGLNGSILSYSPGNKNKI